MNKKERKYLWIIILLVLMYLLTLVSDKDINEVSTVLTTIMALIAAVSFWLQLKRTENLDEANFIMSLNDQFVSNDQMTRIENSLETYYCKAKEQETPTLNLILERGHEDSQRLINYLVYMECLAALIKKDVMHLGVIDDLFAYRFFIAVNNPIVQQFELIPFANYYRGCYELSEMWTKEWRKKGREIPLDQYSLYDCEKYNVACNTKKAEKGKIIIRQATERDNLYEIARCIYLTDPYIYPVAFGNEADQAILAIIKIIKSKRSLFDLENITLAIKDDKLCGIVIYNKEGALWERDRFYESIKEYISDKENFYVASKNYFEVIAMQTTAGNIEVVACCVLPEFRNMGIGKMLIEWISDTYPDYTKTLDVLSNNLAAVRLYQECGYEIVEQYKGFSINEDTRPDCYHMLKKVGVERGRKES